eukprot:Gb_28266 [translate_table: standard]
MLAQSIRMSGNKRNSDQESTAREVLEVNLRPVNEALQAVGLIIYLEYLDLRSQGLRYARKDDEMDIMTKIRELKHYFKQNSMGKDEQISLGLINEPRSSRSNDKKKSEGENIWESNCSLEQGSYKKEGESGDQGANYEYQVRLVLGVGILHGIQLVFKFRFWRNANHDEKAQKIKVALIGLDLQDPKGFSGKVDDQGCVNFGGFLKVTKYYGSRGRLVVFSNTQTGASTWEKFESHLPTAEDIHPEFFPTRPLDWGKERTVELESAYIDQFEASNAAESSKGKAQKLFSELKRVAEKCPIDHLMLGSLAAPLRKIHLESGLGDAIVGIENKLVQPQFNVSLKSVAEHDEQRVEDLAMSTLKMLADEGMKILQRNLFTNDALYAEIAFDMHPLRPDLLRLVPLFCQSLLEMGIEVIDFVQLNQIGGTSVLQDVQFTDQQCFKQFVSLSKARMESQLTGSGHGITAARMDAKLNINRMDVVEGNTIKGIRICFGGKKPSKFKCGRNKIETPRQFRQFQITASTSGSTVPPEIDSNHSIASRGWNLTSLHTEWGTQAL